MSSDAELRAAAELLDKADWSTLYPDQEWAELPMPMFAALKRLADAWLATHLPDDGEPITEAMLPGLGFGGHWGDKWRLQTEVIDIVWENGELCLASRTDKWEVVESGATLGDLRALLAALKVGRADGNRADVVGE